MIHLETDFKDISILPDHDLIIANLTGNIYLHFQLPKDVVAKGISSFRTYPGTEMRPGMIFLDPFYCANDEGIFKMSMPKMYPEDFTLFVYSALGIVDDGSYTKPFRMLIDKSSASEASANDFFFYLSEFNEYYTDFNHRAYEISKHSKCAFDTSKVVNVGLLYRFRYFYSLYRF